MNTRKASLILLVSFIFATLQAQTVSLTDFRLATIGFIPEGEKKPLFETSGSMSGRFVPVYWFRLKAGVSLIISDTEHFFDPRVESQDPAIVFFDGASMEFPKIFYSPLNFSFFTGYYDDLLSDSLLRNLLKAEIPTPEFHEKLAGMVFSTENRIFGTGGALTGIPGNRNVVTGFYVYTNSRTDKKMVTTGDVRLGGITELLKINVYSGISVERKDGDLTMHGGMTALFNSESGNELYVQMGINTYEFGSSDNDKNIYLLFEPRMHWKSADLAISFFSSPILNSRQTTLFIEEGNYLGTNILLGIGNMQVHKMRGGISILGSLNPEEPESVTPFSFSISPFYCVRVSDFSFEITTVIKPLLYDDLYSMAEVMISLKAVY